MDFLRGLRLALLRRAGLVGCIRRMLLWLAGLSVSNIWFLLIAERKSDMRALEVPGSRGCLSVNSLAGGRHGIVHPITDLCLYAKVNKTLCVYGSA